ncbi:Fluorothreonine transaldolase [subsurface metagenome]
MVNAVDMGNLREILSLVKVHEDYRKRTLNLSAAENMASSLVRQCLASDLGNRYFSEYYGGTNFIRQIQESVKRLATEVFNCKFVSVLPVSGHMCDLAVVLGLTNIGDSVAMVPTLDGGYPFNLSIFGRTRVGLPFDEQKQNIDLAALEEFLEDKHPSLVILGASFFLFPHPVQEVSRICHKLGVSVVYDGSHVLGLISGHKFQNPLDECKPGLLFGSTHKSFPGPQGGLLLGNDYEMFVKVHRLFAMQENVYLFDPDNGTILVDNPHPNRIAALGVALAEMKAFGNVYAQQMLRNSKVLAESLDACGIDLFGKGLGFTESHQVILRSGDSGEKGSEVKNRLEECYIIADMGVRMSTAEITRRGMKEKECRTIARLISEALSGERDLRLIRRDVQDLAHEFQTIEYTFPELLRDTLR